MPYPEMEDVEKSGLTFIRWVKVSSRGGYGLERLKFVGLLTSI
jgi:hypothetical protein